MDAVMRLHSCQQARVKHVVTISTSIQRVKISGSTKMVVTARNWVIVIRTLVASYVALSSLVCATVPHPISATDQFVR